MRPKPEHTGGARRIDASLLPPGHFVATTMDFAMMTAAERHGEFIVAWRSTAMPWYAGAILVECLETADVAADAAATRCYWDRFWMAPFDGACAVDQETAQMPAPAFRYAHQDLPIAAGELARDQPDPGTKVPSVFELGSVADGRDDRRGRLRANALDGGDPPAWFTFEEYSIDLLVERGDTPIKVPEEIVKL
jgi:hypothetical protein